jgi:propanediol dehydratase small subunit
VAELTYPLARSGAEIVTTAGGRRVRELALDEVLGGRISPGDVRISPETLLRQAAFAEQGGNPQLAANLRRGAELCAFSDDDLLEFYELLRPGRATARQMDDLAARLEAGGATACADLVREARGAYVRRGLTA